MICCRLCGRWHWHSETVVIGDGCECSDLHTNSKLHCQLPIVSSSWDSEGVQGLTKEEWTSGCRRQTVLTQIETFPDSDKLKRVNNSEMFMSSWPKMVYSSCLKWRSMALFNSANGNVVHSREEMNCHAFISCACNWQSVLACVLPITTTWISILGKSVGTKELTLNRGEGQAVLCFIATTLGTSPKNWSCPHTLIHFTILWPTAHALLGQQYLPLQITTDSIRTIILEKCTSAHIITRPSLTERVWHHRKWLVSSATLPI